MQVTRFLRSLVACGLAAAFTTAYAEITIGVSLSLTGGAAGLGVPSKNAIQFWPTEIAGEKLKVVVLDDAGDPAAATRNARRFAEDKADVIVGTMPVPASAAIAQVASEAQVPHFSPAPLEMTDGKDAWTFKISMPLGFYVTSAIEHMKRTGVKTVAFLGLSDGYGDVHLQALNEQAKAAGISVIAVERFTRADTSVTAQAVRVVSARPDAVLVAASGGGSALPQKALKERGYKGKIYHGAASASADFIRLAGKDIEGAYVVTGPEIVSDQLPESHPGRKVALDFDRRYEEVYGAGSRSLFASNMYDVGLVLQTAVPVALKQAKPGTPQFRVALKNAIESMETVASPKGLLRYTATNHWGRNDSARVLVTSANGKWILVP